MIQMFRDLYRSSLFFACLGVGLGCWKFPTAVAEQTEWVNLRMQFVFQADVAPIPKPIEFPVGDPTCMPENLRPISEAMLVDPKTMGIRNFVIYPDTKKTSFSENEIHPSLRTPANPDVDIEIRDCSFKPHVVALRTGQRLKLLNGDGYGHNPSLVFFVNPPESRLQPPGEPLIATPRMGERAPTPLQCNIHPWMKAYVMVAEHPYFGISNREGEILIEKLPVGKEIVFRIWHENLAGPIPSLYIKGRKIDLEQNRLTMIVDSQDMEWGEIACEPSWFAKQL